MNRRTSRRSFPHTVALLALLLASVQAEEGILVLSVTEPSGRPIPNIELSPRGDGEAGVTGSDGRARVGVAPGTVAGQWVSLIIISAPSDLVFVSPWDRRVRVPPFENETENFVPVVLAEQGARDLLNYPEVIRTLAQRINAAAGEIAATETGGEVRLEVARERIADEYGLNAAEVDDAIRAWGDRTEDRYEQGLAAFYEAKFPAATAAFEESLAEAESTFEAARDDVIDRAFFLGESLVAEGRYAEAVAAYGRAVSLSEDDARLLNGWGLAFFLAGEYSEAEPVLERALTIREATLEATDPAVATALNNLALLYEAQGRYAEAEPRYARALAIWEAALGPDHPNMLTGTENYASLLREMGRDTEAAVLTGQGLAALEEWRRENPRE